MKKFYFFALLIMIAQISICQTKLIHDKNGIITFCDQFMEKFLHNKSSEAIQSLKEYSAIDPSEVDKLDFIIKSQIKALENSYGKNFKLRIR